MQTQDGDKTWNFDPWADRYDVIVANDARHYYARYDEVLDAVVEVAGLAPGARVLDIGTGTGNLALRLVACGARVVGLDPSESMLALAREKAGQSPSPNVDFRSCAEPFLEIPYPDAGFDAVVSTYAFHHIPHRLKAASVREMLRVLKHGGRWVLGDLAFEDEAAEAEALREFRWLEEEYFTRLDGLREAFSEQGIGLQTRQFTPVTWVFWAIKGDA
ncbi:MAG: class I SAM-dependent methyltransferase [Anaerolineae bacterium]